MTRFVSRPFHTPGPTGRVSSKRRSLLAGATAWGAAFMIGTPAARAADILRVGDMSSIGLKAFIEASGQGRDIPYEIQWSKFHSGQPEHEAFNAGALDVGETGDTVFLFAYATGGPARAVSAISFDPSFIALLAQPDSGIKVVADLKGKKLAVNAGGGPHLMAFNLIEQAGLAREDVQFVFLNPLDAKPAFASRAVDAWLTWAPYSSLAIEQNGAYPIADLGDTHNLYRGDNFLLVHKDAARTKRALVQDFLDRATRAQHWALANVEVAAAALSRDTRLDLKVARSLLADFKPTPKSIDASVRDGLKRAAQGFHTYGLVKKPIENVDGAFDTSFTTPA